MSSPRVNWLPHLPAPVAHRTERAAPDRKAGGSIPSRRTSFPNPRGDRRMPVQLRFRHGLTTILTTTCTDPAEEVLWAAVTDLGSVAFFEDRLGLHTRLSKGHEPDGDRTRRIGLDHRIDEFGVRAPRLHKVL